MCGTMHGHDSDKYDCGISIVPLARGIGSNYMLEHAPFAQLMHMPHCALGCLGPLKHDDNRWRVVPSEIHYIYMFQSCSVRIENEQDWNM